MMNFNKTIIKVLNNKFLQNINPDEIGLKIQPKKFFEVEDGEVIYKLGDTSNYIYLLVEGQVRVKFYGDKGTAIICKKNKNDFFGENELIDESPRKSSAMADEHCLVYLIDKKVFGDICKHKGIVANILTYGELHSISSSSLDKFKIIPDEKLNEEIIPELTSTPALTTNPLPEDNVYETTINNVLWDGSDLNDFKEINLAIPSIKDMGVEEKDLINSINSEQNEKASNDSNQALLSAINNEENPIILNDTANKPILEPLKFGTDNEAIDNFNVQNKDLLWNELENLNLNTLNDIKKIEEEVNSTTPDSSSQAYNKEEGNAPLLLSDFQENAKLITNRIFNEISSPLRLIKKYAFVLLQNSSSSEANKVLQKIIDQSDYIYNSLQGQKYHLEENILLKCKSLNSSDVMNDIISLLSGYVEFRNGKLSHEIEGTSEIMLDKNLFYQACLQIVKYLCKNIETAKYIFINVISGDTKLIIYLENDKDDIHNSVLGKNFESLKLDNDLGLHYAKRVIQTHGGVLNTYNKPNSLLQFEITLPIVK